MKAVVNSVIEGLKGQPVILALILINLCFLGFVAYIAHKVSIENDDQRKAVLALMQQCLEVRK